MGIEYRKQFKWVLTREYQIILPAEFDGVEFNGKFVSLKNRVLTIRVGYGWDGASGPAIDTENFMQGSCVHDSLYEIIRKLKRKDLRKAVDKLLIVICKKDGMTFIRRQWVYSAVRVAGGRYMDRKNDEYIRTRESGK